MHVCQGYYDFYFIFKPQIHFMKNSKKKFKLGKRKSSVFYLSKNIFKKV